MELKKESIEAFDRGFKVGDSNYNFYPYHPSKMEHLFGAILFSLLFLCGPIIFIGFEIREYLYFYERWLKSWRGFAARPFESPGLFAFQIILMLLFFVGMPLYCLFLWKNFYRHKKMHRLSKEGLYQFGVYLDSKDLLVRIFDADDEPQEFAIDRSSILSCKEFYSSYQSSSSKVPTISRGLMITWKEGEKS